jgi:phospholipid-binding lipoprotein MlaA
MINPFPFRHNLPSCTDNPMMSRHTKIFTTSCLTFSLLLIGCSTTEVKPSPNDPWENWNRGAQTFNDKLDKNILKPIAKGYQAITPKPVDEGITNFFSNINDIGVTINDFMQLKLLQGTKDFSRFLVNTTVGVAGFFDVAKKIDLPKHNEDFGQTLGFWGVPSGNYLVLPFLGSSSPRETAGLLGDALMNPLTYISFGGSAAVAGATAGAKVVEVTDTRADLLSSEKIIDEAAFDRYDFIKNAYRQQREYLVHDGNPPLNDDFDIDAGDGDETPTGGTSSGAPGHKGTTPLPVTPIRDKSGHLLELTDPDKGAK